MIITFHIETDAFIIVFPFHALKVISLTPFYFFKSLIPSLWLKARELQAAFTANGHLRSAWLNSSDWICKELSSFSLFVGCP